MKTIIIYFSQTGSTEKVSIAIQEGIKSITGQCDLVKIKNANPRRLGDYDLIGIGSRAPDVGLSSPGLGDPILGTEAGVPRGGKIPYNVELLIKDMKFITGKHAFTFNTHQAIPEYYFPTIVPMMRNQGLIVIGWAGWYGNPYLPWNLEPFPTEGHPDEQDLKEAEEFGREMVVRSKKISSGDTNLIPQVEALPKEFTPPAQPSWLMFHRYFKYNREKCLYPDCKLCMDNCPADGIDFSIQNDVETDNPAFSRPNHSWPCQKDCAFCAMICPTGAIEIDKALAEQLPAYVNNQNEIILPRFKRQEVDGKFRRLIPEKEVGSRGTFSQTYTRHPKWIIGKGPVKK